MKPLQSSIEPHDVGSVVNEATRQLFADPQKLMEANSALWKEHADQWSETAGEIMA